jgi:hypothetical protein
MVETEQGNVQTGIDEREGLSVAIAGNAVANVFRTPA